MLTVSNLSKTYGSQVVFDVAGFTVGPGERVGLVGRNGSGKTTLLRLLLGQEDPDGGTIGFPRGYRMGHLSQQISFSEKTVLEEVCRYLGLSAEGADETYRAKRILFGLGFNEEDFFVRPWELSSGYQIRLNLAKVLVSAPDILLLDEPTNYLDIVSIRWLREFLQQWKGQLIIITHDRGFMDTVTTHTMGIFRGKIRKIAGPTEKLYQQILKEEEVLEQTRANEERVQKELESFINRFRAQATRARSVQSRIKTLQKRVLPEKIAEERDLDFQFTPAPFHGRWLIEATGLSFSYDPGGPPLIRSLRLSVGKRDRIGVIGKNGKGKTTLLSLLAGELQPTKGTIDIHENVKTAYFGQRNLDRLKPDRTIEEEILGALTDKSRGRARGICGAMLFEGDKALKKIGVLSGGERSRVLLGTLLASPANLLLLDEPTNHLDMESVDSLIEAIRDFEGAVIIATHSEMVLHVAVSKLIVFDRGGVDFYHGTYQDFLERVGWASEEGVVVTGQKEERQKAFPDKKGLRRLRAEVVTRRSRVLTPLQRQIALLEEKISDLEAGLARDEEALLRASQAGEGKSIVALSISIHEARLAIEEAFEALDSLSREHLLRSQEFEAALEEIGGLTETAYDR
jgi:ATP-binding cassette subfamily F protein 3